MMTKFEILNRTAETLHGFAVELMQIAESNPDDQDEINLKLNGVDELLFQTRAALRVS